MTRLRLEANKVRIDSIYYSFNALFYVFGIKGERSVICEPRVPCEGGAASC